MECVPGLGACERPSWAQLENSYECTHACYETVERIECRCPQLESPSGSIEPPSNLIRHRCCPALRGWDRTTRQERKRLKRCVLLLGHKPKVEVRRMLLDRKEIDAVGSSNSFDRRDKSSHDRTELDTLSRSHLAKIQKMSSGLDDYRSHMGHLQWGVLHKKVFSFDDVAPLWAEFPFPLASGR
jgi:hypothetical protein